MVSSSYYHIHFAQFNVCIKLMCTVVNLMCHENEVTVGYYLPTASLGIDFVSLKFKC